MVLRDHVSAIDELAMATERLRVRHPEEPKPSHPVLHIIEPHEVKFCCILGIGIVLNHYHWEVLLAPVLPLLVLQKNIFIAMGLDWECFYPKFIYDNYILYFSLKYVPRKSYSTNT